MFSDDYPICESCEEYGIVISEIDRKIDEALEIAHQYSQIDGSHHKAWVIDQMVRKLLGNNYDAWIKSYKFDDPEDDEEQYEWDEGIAP